MLNSYISLMQDTPHTVPDDASVVQPLFKKMQQNFKSGATKQAQFRKQALTNLFNGYKELKHQFSQATCKDLGTNQFLFHIFHYLAAQTEIKDLIDNFEKWMKPKSVDTPIAMGNTSSRIQYNPLGVVLVLSAWNYPIYTALPQVAAAIAAGNSVILKPSQIASQNSRVLKKLFDKYLDPKYYTCLEGKVQIAKAVSKQPFDMICFTGSTFTGRLVGIEAAKNLTPCLLQLGGKCPTIVDESANIDSAVNRILAGRFLNCGQTCVAVDHLYVHESIYGRFKENMLTKLKQGYSNEQYKSGDFGKIINQARFDRLQELLNDNHGGKVIYGGNTDKSRFYFAPTVIQNPKKDSLMMKEQIFGPILPIFSYQNISTVIDEVNSRDKPLAVYVFSQNKSHIDQIKNNTQSGCFSVNQAVIQVANNHLPFGGVGKSGYGRYHGQSGFKYFSNERSIVIAKSGDMAGMGCRYPPFTQQSKNKLLKLAKFGSITYSQIGTFLIVILIIVVLGVGLGVGIPAIMEANK